MSKQNTGVPMQGRIENTKKGLTKGKALCQECKFFKYGYYCEKYKGSAHFPNKRKKCRFFETDRAWTPEEEELLLQLVYDQEKPKEISKILNRSFKEIDNKFNELDK